MLTDEMKAAGWIEHDGGPCPVNCCVNVLLRSGLTGYVHPYNSRWVRAGMHPLDIIAYKPENSRGD